MLLKKQQLDDKTDCEGMSLVTSVPKEKEGVVGRARAAEASTHCSSIVTKAFHGNRATGGEQSVALQKDPVDWVDYTTQGIYNPAISLRTT